MAARKPLSSSAGPAISPTTQDSGEPAYIPIARRKRRYRWSQIPSEWRIPPSSPCYSYVLPAAVEPSGDINSDSEDEAASATLSQGRSVVDVVRKCGMLTKRELELTEGYDCLQMTRSIGRGALSAAEVVKAFCKVCIPRFHLIV